MTLPISAHFPVIRARAGSVTSKVFPASSPEVHQIVKIGKPPMSKASGLFALASAMPIFNGALTKGRRY